LARIGLDVNGSAQPAIGQLTEALEDPVERVRVSAAWAISSVGEENPKALEVLASGLASRDEDVIETALDGLSEYRYFGREFFARQKSMNLVPGLLRTLQNGDATRRARCAGFLGGCGDKSNDVTEALGRALLDPADGVRAAAAFSLTELQLPNVPEQVFPVLCDYFEKHDDGTERIKVYWAFGRLGQFPRCVVETLTKHLMDSRRSDQLEIACLLSRHPGNSTADVERVLVELVNTGGIPHWSDRVKVIEALGRLGLSSPEGRKIVEDATNHPQEEVRAAAERVLKAASR
jgi:HEAT repeat protein